MVDIASRSAVDCPVACAWGPSGPGRRCKQPKARVSAASSAKTHWERPTRPSSEFVEACPTNMLCLTAFPTPHDRMVRDGYCLRRPSRPRHPFSEQRVASRGSQMTRRAFGMPCKWPSDDVTTPPEGQPPGLGPSGGHEKHPGLAANAADFVFQPCRTPVPVNSWP